MKSSAQSKKLLGILLAAFAVSPVAYGADLFSLLDKNTDGVLSGHEVAFFKAYASTLDGEISKQEFDAAITSRRARVSAEDRKLFAARDGNQDDRLSGTEISGYEFTDLDRDGRIPESEFLEGMMSSRNLLGSMTPEELEAESKRRFQLMDINEDNRLSGTEAVNIASFDMNEDRRITLDEFITGVFLDAAASRRDSVLGPTKPLVEPIKSVIEAVNGLDDRSLTANLRPELKVLMDGLLVNYLLHHIQDAHGQISIPSQKGIEIKDGEQAGSLLYTAKTKCAKGMLSIQVLMYEGAILGLVFASPEVDGLNETMFAELFADKDGILKRFADFYSPQCQKMISHIFANEESAAVGLFHPEIQVSIGPKRFMDVFAGLRSGCGELASIKLETAGVEFDENKKGKFFTISHRVSGSKGVMLIEHKMQIIGLKAHFVAIRGEHVTASDEVPQTTDAAPPTIDRPVAPSAPSTDDDPVPPPAPGKAKR